MSDPQADTTRDRDLPDSLEGEELTKEPSPDQAPSDPDVQSERPLDDIGETEG